MSAPLSTEYSEWWALWMVMLASEAQIQVDRERWEEIKERGGNRSSWIAMGVVARRLIEWVTWQDDCRGTSGPNSVPWRNNDFNRLRQNGTSTLSLPCHTYCLLKGSSRRWQRFQGHEVPSHDWNGEHCSWQVAECFVGVRLGWDSVAVQAASFSALVVLFREH